MWSFVTIRGMPAASRQKRIGSHQISHTLLGSTHIKCDLVQREIWLKLKSPSTQMAHPWLLIYHLLFCIQTTMGCWIRTCPQSLFGIHFTFQQFCRERTSQYFHNIAFFLGFKVEEKEVKFILISKACDHYDAKINGVKCPQL